MKGIEKSRRLRELILAKETLVMPDAFDPIEDQVLGQPGPKRVIPREAMIEKLEAAREAGRRAGNGDLVINGRTDALAVATDRVAGLEEATARANAYLAAGADLTFVTAVATMDEARVLVREVKGPLTVAVGMPYNLNTMSVKALKETGIARVSLPAVAIFSVVRAVTDTLRSIRDTGDFADVLDSNRLCGMEDIGLLLKRG